MAVRRFHGPVYRSLAPLPGHRAQGSLPQSSTALVAAAAPQHVPGRALARFQLSTGFSLAISPAIITALAARGPAALWVFLTVATLLAAAAVARPSAAAAEAP